MFWLGVGKIVGHKYNKFRAWFGKGLSALILRIKVGRDSTVKLLRKLHGCVYTIIMRTQVRRDKLHINQDYSCYVAATFVSYWANAKWLAPVLKRYATTCNKIVNVMVPWSAFPWQIPTNFLYMYFPGNPYPRNESTVLFKSSVTFYWLHLVPKFLVLVSIYCIVSAIY